MQFFVSAVVFCPLVSALVFVAPQATPHVVELHPQGWSPRPTDPPTFNIELLKRQSASSLTQIEGPDSVCGYEFGIQDGGIGLCYTSTCGFATGLDQWGEIYCYDATTSAPRPLWTSCLGGTLAISCLADSACSNNPGIALCTVSTEPYCNVGTFIGLGVEAVWCDSTFSGGSTIPIYTTYTGQLGRIFTNPTSSTAISTTTSSSIVSTHTASTTTPTQTSMAPSPTPIHTPVGPIVGGVIGGLAFITAIVAGGFLCLRQNHKDKQTIHASDLPTYTPTNNAPSQQPSDKYPATAKVTSIPAGYPLTSFTPGQQIHYQQAPQPQYQQRPPFVQPSYNVYPPPQQQIPQPNRNYMQQQQSIQQPVQQTQQHHPQNFEAQSYPPSVQPQPQPQSSPQGAHRGSVASSASAPGSPAAPSYTSRIPAVPETTAVTGHQASPTNDRYEMPM